MHDGMRMTVTSQPEWTLVSLKSYANSRGVIRIVKESISKIMVLNKQHCLQ